MYYSNNNLKLKNDALKSAECLIAVCEASHTTHDSEYVVVGSIYSDLRA